MLTSNEKELSILLYHGPIINHYHGLSQPILDLFQLIFWPDNNCSGLSIVCQIAQLGGSTLFNLIYLTTWAILVGLNEMGPHRHNGLSLLDSPTLLCLLMDVLNRMRYWLALSSWTTGWSQLDGRLGCVNGIRLVNTMINIYNRH